MGPRATARTVPLAAPTDEANGPSLVQRVRRSRPLRHDDRGAIVDPRGDIGVSWLACRCVFGGKGRIGGHRGRRWVVGALTLVALALTACSGSSGSTSVITIRSGQAPPGALPTGGVAKTAGDATAATVPLAQQNPTTAPVHGHRGLPVVPEEPRSHLRRGARPEQPLLPGQQPQLPQEPCDVRHQERHPPGPQGGAVRPGQPDAGTGQEGEQGLPQVAHVHDRPRGGASPRPHRMRKGLLFSFGGTGGGGGASGASGSSRRPARASSTAATSSSALRWPRAARDHHTQT